MMDDVTFLPFEILSEMPGLNGDKTIWEYLKEHWADHFPNLPACKIFVHQPKKLHEIKALFFICLFRLRNGGAIIDSLPL